MTLPALLLVGLATALSLGGMREVLGLPTREIAPLLVFAAVALSVTGWAIERGRPSWRAAAGALAMWAVFIATALVVYAGREGVIEGAASFADELGLGGPSLTVSGNGEVVIARGRDGSFTIPAQVNDRDARFVFDTGASTVVLTAETTAALGFKPEALRFRIPVSTANGQALAAPVRLDRVRIGGLEFRNVSALASRPGMLHENLLGQTLLERLGSYEVRGSRLVLRGRTG